MASAALGSSTVPVEEVVAMDDDQLAQFMQRHLLPNGDYHLPVSGWDNLSRDELSHLAERLETQKRSRAQACSHPLDLVDLDARLRQVAPNESFTLRPECQFIHYSRSPTPPIDVTRDEKFAYHDLVNDGGRPAYPIGLIQEVYRDATRYVEILRPWQKYDDSPEGIFQAQLQRWQNFRKWQNDHRDLDDDDDGGFPAFVEWTKDVVLRDFLPSTREKRLAEIEADPSCLKSRWDERQFIRERQRRLCREKGSRGFREYTEAVKRRLARHNIAQTVELDEDPKKQDKLTTWIEYLNYEYWWFDKYASDIERLEPEHDKLWQELVEKNILKPHETKEFVRTVASAMEAEMEKDMGRKAVQRAKSKAKRIYLLTQKDPKRLDIPRAERILMLERASEDILAAGRQLEEAVNRSRLITQFVRATFGYHGAKTNAARHRFLIQWILDQLRLIESEVNLSSENRSGSNGKRRTKRRRTNDQEQAERQEPKRARIDLRESRMANIRTLSRVTETRAEKQSVASNLPRKDVPTVLGGSRRSARIAARRDASRSY